MISQVKMNTYHLYREHSYSNFIFENPDSIIQQITTYQNTAVKNEPFVQFLLSNNNKSLLLKLVTAEWNTTESDKIKVQEENIEKCIQYFKEAALHLDLQLTKYEEKIIEEIKEIVSYMVLQKNINHNHHQTDAVINEFNKCVFKLRFKFSVEMVCLKNIVPYILKNWNSNYQFFYFQLLSALYNIIPNQIEIHLQSLIYNLSKDQEKFVKDILQNCYVYENKIDSYHIPNTTNRHSNTIIVFPPIDSNDLISSTIVTSRERTFKKMFSSLGNVHQLNYTTSHENDKAYTYSHSSLLDVLVETVKGQIKQVYQKAKQESKDAKLIFLSIDSGTCLALHFAEMLNLHAIVAVGMPNRVFNGIKCFQSIKQKNPKCPIIAFVGELAERCNLNFLIEYIRGIENKLNKIIVVKDADDMMAVKNSFLLTENYSQFTIDAMIMSKISDFLSNVAIMADKIQRQKDKPKKRTYKKK
ncbi:hypothetical protein A3Q56_02990 [Intoshia linei]|uniref:KAT8 regulatory NSL complex subunit 3 n=1 Tax=Intoshia linei TaxID=1819745 RepID=A0A177B6A3_9BILA|nr:hypothetical protein A3Q56_02990 [Intoshia linei]